MRSLATSSFRTALVPVALAAAATLSPPAHAQDLTGREWCHAFGIAESFRVVTDENRANVGFRCAVLPSATDPAIADRNPPTVADVQDLDDLVCGYGAHAVGFPGDP
ncbi:MAG: hypothetical protein AAGF23_15885, partial [Acidobacteriota bacterium]